MVRGRTVQAFRGDSLNLEARIVQAIQKVGPKNVSLLSRMTGAHAETIRYKVKRQFRTLGFRIDADIDHEKLGLLDHWAELSFARKYRPIAKEILSALSESAYLTYYGKVVPSGDYLCVFAGPTGSTDDLRSLLDELRATGILHDFAIDRAVFSRNDPMMPAHFDFRAGRWDVDWAKVRLSPPRPLPVRREQRPSDVDEYDLMLMRELQADALRHVVGIARKLRVHQKTLEYHYRAHVQKQKLIASYHMRWVGEPDGKDSPAVLLTALRFKDLGEELQRVQNAVSKIPFLWRESLTEGGEYIALLVTPIREAVNVLSFVSEQAPNLHEKVELGYISAADSTIFGVPSHLYKNGWAFDARAAKTKIAKLVKKRN